jgi:hypothetical protein
MNVPKMTISKHLPEKASSCCGSKHYSELAREINGNK